MHLVQSMAYVGDVPWHGLGHCLTPNQPLDVWAQQAGMNWRIEAADVHYIAGHPFPGSLQKYPDQKVLYRSDTKVPLSIVSSRYKPVQPAEILEFYRDLTEIGGTNWKQRVCSKKAVSSGLWLGPVRPSP